MSHMSLVETYKREMRIESSIFITHEEDEAHGHPIREEWFLEMKFQTDMSTVFLATNRVSGQRRIIKRVPATRFSFRELDALIQLNASGFSRFFVGFYRWFESMDQIFCMMEYFPLGDLGNFVKNIPRPEPWIQTVTSQILRGIKAMHAMGYAHRDIKPGNILMASNDPPQVKICDFGISKRINEGETSFINSGSLTRPYAAPEVLHLNTSKKNDRINNKVDIWALGCVVGELVTGDVLFHTTTEIANFCGSLKVRDNLLFNLSQHIQPAGVEFIAQLLTVDPSQRPSAERALELSWLRTRVPSPLPQDASYAQSAADSQQASEYREFEMRNTPLPPRRERSSHPQAAAEVSIAGSRPSQLPSWETPVSSPQLASTPPKGFLSQMKDALQAGRKDPGYVPARRWMRVMPLDGNTSLAPMSVAIDSPLRIIEVKRRIQTNSSIPPDEQILTYLGNQLKDDKLTSDYNIRHGCTIRLAVRQPPDLAQSDAFQSANGTIYVKTLAGKTLTLNVDLPSSVRVLKDLVAEKEGIPQTQQRLIFIGKELNDRKSTKDYGIVTGSTIHLVLRLRGE